MIIYIIAGVFGGFVIGYWMACFMAWLREEDGCEVSSQGVETRGRQ